MTTVIPAPPDRVWEDVARIASHVEWMADAMAIHFQSDQQDGVGTTFTTDTRVGPFRLTDKMVITEWEAGRVMGIRHTGVVTGSGRFILEEIPGVPVQTRFTWEENLRFPPWMGGSLGGRAGGLILTRIWRRNLDNLRRRFE
ncbi:MAG: SRPBCC family protein [Actinomycetota bacterium]|nr:SRPBCC family protein [Actinomycetota bacterium]